MFKTERLRDNLIRKSGWVPHFFPVSKFDMGSLVSRAFIKKIGQDTPRERWERKRLDLILFDELNNTRDIILLVLVI